MGYMVHHTIVVSFWDERLLRKAWRRAKSIFTVCQVSNITPVVTNGERSFFVAPDGSKAGWDTSCKGHKERLAFIGYLNSMRPYPVGWVLVQFAGAEKQTLVLDSSDHRSKGIVPSTSSWLD